MQIRFPATVATEFIMLYHIVYKILYYITYGLCVGSLVGVEDQLLSPMSWRDFASGALGRSGSLGTSALGRSSVPGAFKPPGRSKLMAAEASNSTHTTT